ncbi:hypothetical protein Tco_0080858, partial [Tanacetum coccineum]
TLAQTLIKIKSIKPKAVTTDAITITHVGIRPKAKGVVIQEPGETTTTKIVPLPSKVQEKDKGKAKMVEPEKPVKFKGKDQISLDEELARKLEAEMLQAEEQREITIKERTKLFVELMNRRKKHFAKLRAEEIRRKPPTKAQKKNQMSTYLKNMSGYKHSQLKSKSYDEIQKLFDKEMKRVNTFVDMNSEVVKGSETRTEESSKRAGDELESDKSKKQKLDKHVEAEKDDQEKAEMKRHIEIVKDDEVAIDAIPLATKPLVIVEYKIDNDGRMGYFKLIKADRSSKRNSSMIKLLQDIDREDLET